MIFIFLVLFIAQDHHWHQIRIIPHVLRLRFQVLPGLEYLRLIIHGHLLHFLLLLVYLLSHLLLLLEPVARELLLLLHGLFQHRVHVHGVCYRIRDVDVRLQQQLLLFRTHLQTTLFLSLRCLMQWVNVCSLLLTDYLEIGFLK